jgi:hypothetical protein
MRYIHLISAEESKTCDKYLRLLQNDDRNWNACHSVFKIGTIGEQKHEVKLEHTTNRFARFAVLFCGSPGECQPLSSQYVRRKKPGYDILSSPTMIASSCFFFFFFLFFFLILAGTTQLSVQLWMEWAAVAASEPFLPPGFATVGFHVDVKVLGSTKVRADDVGAGARYAS